MMHNDWEKILGPIGIVMMVVGVTLNMYYYWIGIE